MVRHRYKKRLPALDTRLSPYTITRQSCLRHKNSKCAYSLIFGQTRGWRRPTGSFSANGMSTPMRRIRSPCCAPRRERPCRRRAADERDDFAPPDAKCHLTPPARMRPNDSTVRSGLPPKQEGLSISVRVAYLAHMLQRTLPAGFVATALSDKNHNTAVRQPMAARDQAGWISGYRLSFLSARSGVRRGPAILSGAPKAERKAAPKHILTLVTRLSAP
jgi:hypothetical protein